MLVCFGTKGVAPLLKTFNISAMPGWEKVWLDPAVRAPHQHSSPFLWDEFPEDEFPENEFPGDEFPEDELTGDELDDPLLGSKPW